MFMPSKSRLSRITHQATKETNESKRLFSTQNEVKIWLTPPNCNNPLGFAENESRLIRARVKHPSHNIRLVYEPNNLTVEAKDKLDTLCAEHNVELFSIDNIERELRAQRGTSSMTAESADLQLKLLARARLESIENGGCLAAASDILRTLTPTLQVRDPNTHELTNDTRIYTDFDNTLSARLPTSIELGADELMMPECINNCLFVSAPEGAVLHQVRSNILHNYQSSKGFNELLVSVYVEAMNKSGVNLLSLEQLFQSPYDPFEEKLKALGEIEPEFKFYPVNDLFSLRRALKDLMLHSSGKKGHIGRIFI